MKNLTKDKNIKTIKQAADFSAANSKSLGYDMAVDFGDVCDAISEGIDELFIKKLHEQGENKQDEH